MIRRIVQFATRPWPLVVLAALVTAAVGAATLTDIDTRLIGGSASDSEPAAGASDPDQNVKQPSSAPDRQAPGPTTDVPSDPPRLGVYPERPDQLAGDREAEPGSSVRVHGYDVTVVGAEYQHKESGRDSVVVEVSLQNLKPVAERHRVLFWTLVSDTGEVLYPVPRRDEDGAVRDDILSPSQSQSVSLRFEAERGDYYVAFDPDTYGTERAFWRISV